MTKETGPNTGRKLFFGLFIFPLLIAVGMAVLLCSVVLLTHEEESPESLVSAIKTGPPSKRWQKAFELSNELNKNTPPIRSEGLIKEMTRILRDAEHYDPKTRAYMALALGRFKNPEATKALREGLADPHEDVRLYAMWALGASDAKEAAPDIVPFLKAEDAPTRKMAAYVLGAIGGGSAAEPLKPLLEDPAADVRWNAALGLARVGDDTGLEAIAEMLRREELASVYKMSEAQIQTVMINAVKGLALIRNPESIKILDHVSRHDKNLKVRQAAMDAMRYQNG